MSLELPVARVRADLVGREDVLALAARRWADASGGAGQFLLIAGEAGIGKSRILDEIVTLLDGVPVLTTRAWPRDTEFPGAVLFDLARELRQDGREEVGRAACSTDCMPPRPTETHNGATASSSRISPTSCWASWSASRCCCASKTCIGPTNSASTCSTISLRSSGEPAVSWWRLTAATRCAEGRRSPRWRSRLLGQRLAEEASRASIARARCGSRRLCSARCRRRLWSTI